jgi:ribosome maturation factor RimP
VLDYFLRSEWMTEERNMNTEQRLLSLLGPILTELELVLYDLEVHPSAGRVLVTVDRPGSVGVPGEGVTIEETARVTRRLLRTLEELDGVEFPWVMEVSSPGIERVLRTATHFELAQGQDVRVVLREPFDGRSVLEGVVGQVNLATQDVELEMGELRVTFNVSQMRRGRVVFDFSRPKPGKARKSKKRSADAETTPTESADGQTKQGKKG